MSHVSHQWRQVILSDPFYRSCQQIKVRSQTFETLISQLIEKFPRIHYFPGFEYLFSVVSPGSNQWFRLCDIVCQYGDLPMLQQLVRSKQIGYSGNSMGKYLIKGDYDHCIRWLVQDETDLLCVIPTSIVSIEYDPNQVVVEIDDAIECGALRCLRFLHQSGHYTKMINNHRDTTIAIYSNQFRILQYLCSNGFPISPMITIISLLFNERISLRTIWTAIHCGYPLFPQMTRNDKIKLIALITYIIGLCCVTNLFHNYVNRIVGHQLLPLNSYELVNWIVGYQLFPLASRGWFFFLNISFLSILPTILILKRLTIWFNG